jgi:hypothetical protein
MLDMCSISRACDSNRTQWSQIPAHPECTFDNRKSWLLSCLTLSECGITVAEVDSISSGSSVSSRSFISSGSETNSTPELEENTRALQSFPYAFFLIKARLSPHF